MARFQWRRSFGRGLTDLLTVLRAWRPERPPAPEPVPPPYPWEAHYPAELEWRTEIQVKPLYRLLDDAVATYPDNPCIDFLGRKYSYREIGRLVDRAAKGFQDLGVGPGTKVGLFLPNTPYFVVCYYAVLKAGGTVVNINPLYAEEEIARQIADAEARIVVTLGLKALYPKLAAVMRQAGVETVIACSMADALPFLQKPLFRLLQRKEIASVPVDERHIAFRDLVANEGDCRVPDIDPGRDVALLQYTGGTTGLPKGAMLTHANLYANAVQTAMWFTKMEPGRERILGVLPLFHVFAMTVVMNAGLSQGAELILLPRFRLDAVLNAIHRKRPTLFPGVPTMFAAINACKDLARYDLTSLKFCLSGGAPLPAPVKRAFESLTGCKLVEGYGLTECSPVVTVNPFFGAAKEGSVGLPLPGTIVEITALDDPPRALPPGERGEICVKGPQVMAGYWKQPEETEAALAGGRLHTGDVGYMDSEGHIFITDRIKDLILVGGFNVYPRTVEEAILRHPDVEEVAVCGVPDPYRGETVKAFIVPRAGRAPTLGELRQFLQDKLAPFEMPRMLAMRDSLPRTLLGKTDRKALVAEDLAKRSARAAEPA